MCLFVTLWSWHAYSKVQFKPVCAIEKEKIEDTYA